jgi:hypothetical protein
MSEKETAMSWEQDTGAANEDNRGRVRHRCHIEAFYRAKRCGAEIGWLAEIRDISATGIGLALNRRFPPGSMLFVELTSTIDESAHLLPVTVVHATESDEGHWLLGCTFSRTLNDAELAELVLDAPRGRIFA